MRGRTPAGVQAYAIREWAWSDPAERVTEAISRVAELARGATGAALAECQDVTQMLTRLAGTLAPAEPVAMAGGPQLISIQLAAYHGHHVKGTPFTYHHGYLLISGQAKADVAQLKATTSKMLGHSGKHERLGQAVKAAAAAPAVPHVSPDIYSKSIASQLAEPKTMQAQLRAAAPAGPSAGSSAFAAARAAVAGAPSPDARAGWKGPESFASITPDPQTVAAIKQALHEQSAEDPDDKVARMGAILASSIGATHAQQMNKMLEQVASANTSLSGHLEDVEKEAASDARKKLAVEGAVAVGAAILAGTMAMLGVPALVAIAAALGPTMVQLLVEFKEKL